MIPLDVRPQRVFCADQAAVVDGALAPPGFRFGYQALRRCAGDLSLLRKQLMREASQLKLAVGGGGLTSDLRVGGSNPSGRVTLSAYSHGACGEVAESLSQTRNQRWKQGGSIATTLEAVVTCVPRKVRK